MEETFAEKALLEKKKREKKVSCMRSRAEQEDKEGQEVKENTL